MILDRYLKGKILVAIDAANLESSVKSLKFWIDYVKLYKLFDKTRARLLQRAIDYRQGLPYLQLYNNK